MKRALTILTAALFAGALAAPAMAQSTDSGANPQAPAAAVANPNDAGAEGGAAVSPDQGAAAAQDNQENSQEDNSGNAAGNPDRGASEGETND